LVLIASRSIQTASLRNASQRRFIDHFHSTSRTRTCANGVRRLSLAASTRDRALAGAGVRDERARGNGDRADRPRVRSVGERRHLLAGHNGAVEA
jgi:hypothetical protein